jgi:hypothetical protein
VEGTGGARQAEWIEARRGNLREGCERREREGKREKRELGVGMIGLPKCGCLCIFSRQVVAYYITWTRPTLGGTPAGKGGSEVWQWYGGCRAEGTGGAGMSKSEAWEWEGCRGEESGRGAGMSGNEAWER